MTSEEGISPVPLSALVLLWLYMLPLIIITVSLSIIKRGLCAKGVAEETGWYAKGVGCYYY